MNDLGGRAPPWPGAHAGRDLRARLGRMKPTGISAEALFEEFRPAMHWEWIAGHAHPERHFDETACAMRAPPPTWSAT